MKESDHIILDLIKKGDKKGLEMLFEDFYRPLVAYAYTYIRNKEESEDIVQEVFIKLWESKKLLQVDTNIRIYMYQSVKNTCLNWLKNKSRINTETIENVPELSKDFFDEGDWNDYIEEVHRKIERLPEKTREIFKSVVIENKKYKEAAEDFGISVNTVKTVLTRALDNLRNGLRKGVYFLFTIFF